MLWVKAFHIIFMVTWFAGLFYLPRLFVYHAEASDEISNARFKIMERKLFWGITTPGGVLTIVFGLWLIHYLGTDVLGMLWMQIKLALVGLLVAYHIWCGKLVADFKPTATAARTSGSAGSTRRRCWCWSPWCCWWSCNLSEVARFEGQVARKSLCTPPCHLPLVPCPCQRYCFSSVSACL